MRLYVNGTLAQTLADAGRRAVLLRPAAHRRQRHVGRAPQGRHRRGPRLRPRAHAPPRSSPTATPRSAAGSVPPPPPPPPPGPGTPVVALGFDEGAGTTAADASGGGRNGTLSGPTWTTDARFGRALSFDGVNDWVTVPDSAALDITGPLTVEAWVKLRTSGAWQTVAIKEAPGNLAYGLYASSSGSPLPSGWLGDAGFYGPKTVPVGAWTHLALSYDGSVSHLYVNGVSVASRAGAAGIPSTARRPADRRQLDVGRVVRGHDGRAARVRPRVDDERDRGRHGHRHQAIIDDI